MTVPNAEDAIYSRLAQPDSTDLAILAAGFTGYGVLTGLEVTPKAVADMSVDVAAGTAFVAGAPAAAGSVTDVPVPAASASLNRMDLIVIEADGTVTLVEGTPSSSAPAPAIPVDSTAVAYVFVPASATVIQAANIVFKGVQMHRHSGQEHAGQIVPSAAYLDVSETTDPGAPGAGATRFWQDDSFAEFVFATAVVATRPALAGEVFAGSLVQSTDQATFTIPDIPARDFLTIRARLSLSSSQVPAFRINDDDGSVYGGRFISVASGGTTWSNVEQSNDTELDLSGSAGTDFFIEIEIDTRTNPMALRIDTTLVMDDESTHKALQVGHGVAVIDGPVTQIEFRTPSGDIQDTSYCVIGGHVV